MSRIGNARTIADIEYVIDGPRFGSEQSSWMVHGVTCRRERHRYVGQDYSFALDVLSLRCAPSTRSGWHVVILSETWRFAEGPSEARTTKSLKVLRGKAADILAWMRRHRTAKLEAATREAAPDVPKQGGQE